MIIQKVIKGIGGIDQTEVNKIFDVGICCNWWRNYNPLKQIEVPKRLTERNLIWHQNNYDQPDPMESYDPFYLRTPFISTTAGTVERDTFYQTNVIQSAWSEALRFATDGWQRDGYLFYCYVFILSKKTVRQEFFAEELRELNIYTGYSPFQPEGEITAKIIIPPSQIEKAEFWTVSEIMDATNSNRLPRPNSVQFNNLYLPPERLSNIRDVLA